VVKWEDYEPWIGKDIKRDIHGLSEQYSSIYMKETKEVTEKLREDTRPSG
jgi:hypothetical protein